MKRFCDKLIVLVMLSVSLTMWADIIVKKDGSSIEVFNIEVGKKFITYTQESSPDSELGRINRDECFAIKADGEDLRLIDAIDIAYDSQTVEEKKGEPSEITIKNAVESTDNKLLIDKYNTATVNLTNYKEDSKKIHSGFSLTVWGIGSESVMSDDNMTISIEPMEATAKKNGKYQFAFTNKTDENLYIDLTNSFKVNGKGVAKPFYDAATYSMTHGNNSGGSLNLGAVTNAIGIGGAVGTLASGMSVGSGSSNSVQIIKSDQPILVVPPHSKVILPLEKAVNGNDVEELAEVFYFAGSYYDFMDSYAPYVWGQRDYEDDGDSNIYSDDIQLHKNGIVEFDENRSPKTYRYFISYVKESDSTTVIKTPFSVYLRGIYGFKPASKSTAFSSTLQQIVMSAPPQFIWGFGTLQKDNSPNSKESKRALKKALGGY